MYIPFKDIQPLNPQIGFNVNFIHRPINPQVGFNVNSFQRRIQPLNPHYSIGTASTLYCIISQLSLGILS